MVRSRLFTREFFVTGDLTDACVAKLSSWHGVAVWGHRNEFHKVLERKETNRSGIYLLRRPARRGEKLMIYIGEADNLNIRLKQQEKNHNWWTEVVTFSSRAENFLHPTNRKFVESKLLHEINEKNHVIVKNSKIENPPDLGYGDKWDIENFLAGIKDILRLLEIKDFTPDAEAVDNDSHSLIRPHEQIQEFELRVPSEGGVATAYYNRNTKEFIVQKGSRARKEWASQRDNASEKRHRERLFKDGSLKIDGDGLCRFTRNVRFKTPSAAAGVIAGLSMSGLQYWKVPGTEKTFRDWLRAGCKGVQSPEPRKKTREPRKHPVLAPPQTGGQMQEFEMKVPSKGGTATAIFDKDTGKFIVLKGSHARGSWKSGVQRHDKQLHEDLLRKRSLVRKGDICRFMEDVPFDSPSSAAGVISGRPANGNITWKVLGGKQTFKDWLNVQRNRKVN